MKHILVGVDGSERAPAVLAAAAALAGRTGAKLWLLRAVGLPPEIPPQAYSIAPAELPRLLETWAAEELAQLSRRVPDVLVAGMRVTLGVPWQVICDAARLLDVGLIMIGSHGYRGIDRVIGTTAAKVVNHADRSVLVVRAPELLELGGRSEASS